MNKLSDATFPSEPDIVQTILQRVIAMAPQFSQALSDQIEQEIRAEYGGQRVRIPKRGKYLTLGQRQALFQDGLSRMTNDEIVEKHKISRRTLYREMKKGSAK